MDPLEHGRKVSRQHRSKRPRESPAPQGGSAAQQGAVAPRAVLPRLSEDITAEMVPGITRAHAAETLRTLSPEDSNVALRLQARGAASIEKSGEFSFATRPDIVTSWKMHSVLKAHASSNIFTRVVPSAAAAAGAGPAGPIGHAGPADGNLDPTVLDAAAWDPMVPSGDRFKVADIDPAHPILIAARDGSRGYVIDKGVSSGSYGAVYFATATKDGRPVALKFVDVRPQALMRVMSEDGEGVATIISPGSMAGLFSHYVLQRAYGGCMPMTVCLYDTFLFAKPRTADPNSQLTWYIVMAMEKMKGSVDRMVIERPFYLQPAEAKFARCVALFAKMTRAIFDMEVQSIFHNDIKPQNFLYNDDGTVKVTDFDLGCFASRMRGAGDNITLLRQQFVSYNTDGAVDASKDPWMHNPQTRTLMRCMFQTTETYEPPEYRVIKDMWQDAKQRNDARLATDILARTLNNSEWLSRMMAYQLASSFRELVLMCGLNLPLYNPVDRSYPMDVRKPTGTRRTGVSPSRYVAMAFDGQYPLAPTSGSMDRKIDTYIDVRLNSVHLDAIKGEAIRGVATNLNRMLGVMIAPKHPTRDDPTTVFPVDPKTYLCTGDTKPDQTRPTVPMLMRFLSSLMQRLKELMPELPMVTIPADLSSELEAARLVSAHK